MLEKNHSPHKHLPSFNTLQKLIEQILCQSEYEKLIEQIPIIACQHTSVNRSIYFTVQDRKLRLVSAYCSHHLQWRKEFDSYREHLVSIDGHFPEAQVVRTGKPIITNHPQKELATPLEKWMFGEVTAHISVPVVSQGKVIGMLVCLYTEENKQIEEKEKDFFILFATIIGCAIRSTSIIERVAQKENELAALNKLSQMLSVGKKLPEILPLLAREIAKTLQAKICIIRYREGDDMILGAVVGMEPNELSERFPAQVGLSGWMVKERKVLVVKDLTTDPRVDNRVLIFSRKQGLRSFIGAPLYFRDKLVGLTAIYTTTPRYFTNEEKELLSHFAVEAALAIELTK